MDWFRVITDLQRHGYGFRSIGVAISSGKSTVRGWYSGASPSYEQGERLLCLWSSVTGKPLADVPRISRYSPLA